MFCQISQGQVEARRVWENEDFLAIPDKYPKAPVHLLVIPKTHVSKLKQLLAVDEQFWGKFLEAVFEVIKLEGLDKGGYKLVNNGAGYNHFDHEHMHILGGTKTEPV